MNDADLMKISNEVDNLLFKLASEYEITALSLTAVVLARLAIMCDELECRDDMNKLLNSVSKINQVNSPHATIQ